MTLDRCGLHVSFDKYPGAYSFFVEKNTGLPGDVRSIDLTGAKIKSLPKSPSNLYHPIPFQHTKI